jgi:hypothetical protein
MRGRERVDELVEVEQFLNLGTGQNEHVSVTVPLAAHSERAISRVHSVYFVKKPTTNFPVVASRTTEKWEAGAPTPPTPTVTGVGDVNVTTHAGTLRITLDRFRSAADIPAGGIDAGKVKLASTVVGGVDWALLS